MFVFFTNERELPLHISAAFCTAGGENSVARYFKPTQISNRDVRYQAHSLVSYFVLLCEFFFQLGQMRVDKSNFS